MDKLVRAAFVNDIAAVRTMHITPEMIDATSMLIDGMEYFPLMAAVCGGSYEVFEYLLYECGADATRREKTTGRTLLHFAIIFNHGEFIEPLCEAGVNPDAADHNGFTPLLEAAILHNATAIRALAAVGANLDAFDPEGLPIIVSALLMRNDQVLRAFIEAGADIDATNPSGYTALDMAIFAKLGNECVQLLKAGATCGGNVRGDVTIAVVERRWPIGWPYRKQVLRLLRRRA